MPLQSSPDVAPPPQAPAPPAPATPAAPPAPVVTGAVVDGQPIATPADIYQGMRAQRRELADQLESLEEKRQELSQTLQDPMVGGADRAGIEQRITAIDQRIVAVEQQIASADGEVARAAALPGATVEPPPPPRDGPPEEVFVLAGMFIFVVLLPMSIAYSRRIWRRGAQVVSALPREVAERFTRLEQAIDAVAVEVERIGEGQRFMTNFFTEKGGPRALGVGAAEPVEAKAREAEPVRR